MSDIKRDSLITTEEKLLFDILQVLREIKQPLEPQEVLRLMAMDAKCKHCGKVHENKGQKLACAKKHKKEKQEKGEGV